jgi:hypothetical protein
VPTPEERLEGLWEKYRDRLMRPAVSEHGAKVREEALQEAETYRREVEIGDHETAVVEDVVERRAEPWYWVVSAFLADYERYRNLWLRMAKGREGFDREEFDLPMNNSFAPEYQRKQYARLKALKRQLIGEGEEESPTGEEIEGEYSEPVTVLFGLTSSSTTDDGEYRSPVDHDREIRDAWGGSSGVRRTLRYVVEEGLGVPSDKWAYWFQSEPHTGGGAASGYSHAHPVVILDESETDRDAPVRAEDFTSVVHRHVEECEGAGWDAHEIDDTVTVREPGEIGDWASYVSEYIAVSPDKDLLERSDEYLMWAATQWATGTQKYSKSGTATAAVNADKCHQQYADAETDQTHDHGERVRRASRGDGWECAECGSAHGIDQSGDTLTERRLTTDGGEEGGDVRPVERGESRSLSARWPSARSAGCVGSPVSERPVSDAPEGSSVSYTARLGGGADWCPACHTEEPEGEECSHPEYETHPIVEGADGADVVASSDGSEYRGTGWKEIEYERPPDTEEPETEGFERPARWKAVAVVDKAREEEHGVSGVGGVDYGEVVIPGEEGVGEYGHLLPSDVSGPEPWRRCAWVSEEEVRSGDVPPPELLGREHAERREGRPVTRKQWPDDWYSRRYERDDHADGDAVGHGEESSIGDELRRAVEEYRSRNPSASVAEIAGGVAAAGSPEEVREVVAELGEE